MSSTIVLFQIQSRTIQSLPDVLVFNCKLENAKDIEFWRTQQEVYCGNYTDFCF